MAKPTKRALRKWTVITTICAAHSFFWGLEVTQNIPYGWIAMVLGVLTLIAIFSTVESHPRYSALKSRRPSFAAAMRWGIRIRCFYSFLAPISAIMIPKSMMFQLLILAEVYTGVLALAAVKALTGNNLTLHNPGDLPYFATYLATLITAAIHTTILALLCLMLYSIISAIKTMTRKRTNDAH